MSAIQSQVNKVEIFVVPQNDDPGQVWAQKIGATLSTSYKLLSVPEKYHDANDWLKDPGNIKELIGTIQDATSKEPGSSKSRIYIECHRPSYFLAYQPPPDLVLCGDNHIVRGGAAAGAALCDWDRDYKHIFELISFRRSACDWQFLFMGAKRSRTREIGLSLGVQRSNIVEFDANPEGVSSVIAALSNAFRAYQLGDKRFALLLKG